MARIQGIGILSVVKALRIERGTATKLLPESLRHYLYDTISIDAWYPEDDGFELLRALARLVPETGADVWEAFGRQRAEADLVEIYPSPIERGDPLGGLQRLEQVWRRFHDTGRTVVERLAPRKARIELHDYQFNGDELGRLLRGYVTRALHLSGAVGVEVELLAGGSPTEPAVLQASWSGEE